MPNVCNGNTPRLRHTVTAFAWGTGAVLMLLGIYIIIVQWAIALSYRFGKRNVKTDGGYSCVPIIGPLLFTIGAYLLPNHLLRPYAWICWLTDYGTLALIYCLPTLIREIIGGSRPRNSL